MSAKIVVAAVFAAAAIGFGIGHAGATPSDDVQRDHLCLNPAYANMHEVECRDAVDPREYN